MDPRRIHRRQARTRASNWRIQYQSAAALRGVSRHRPPGGDCREVFIAFLRTFFCVSLLLEGTGFRTLEQPPKRPQTSTNGSFRA